MELTVFVGDDLQAIQSRRRQLLDAAGGATGRFDVSDDGPGELIDAVGSPSLFGGRRVVSVDGVETLTDRALDQLASVAPQSDAVVVARANAALPARVRERLKSLGTIVSCTPPKGRAIGARIDAMVDSAQLQLPADVRRLIGERCGHDLDRVDSLLRSLVIAGITSPTRAQVQLLLGTAAAPGVPWALSDAIEAGDVAGTVAACGGLEPLAALGYLTSRATQIGQIVETAVDEAGQVQELLGLSHRFQADRLLRAARTLGPAGVRRMWDILGRADNAVKRSGSPSAFESVVVDITRLYRST